LPSTPSGDVDREVGIAQVDTLCRGQQRGTELALDFPRRQAGLRTVSHAARPHREAPAPDALAKERLRHSHDSADLCRYHRLHHRERLDSEDSAQRVDLGVGRKLHEDSVVRKSHARRDALRGDRVAQVVDQPTDELVPGGAPLRADLTGEAQEYELCVGLAAHGVSSKRQGTGPRCSPRSGFSGVL
jgi:hypothetical protein